MTHEPAEVAGPPLTGGTEWMWSEDVGGSRAANSLPVELFARLQGGRRRLVTRSYPTREQALQALADAQQKAA